MDTVLLVRYTFMNVEWFLPPLALLLPLEPLPLASPPPPMPPPPFLALLLLLLSDRALDLPRPVANPDELSLGSCPPDVLLPVLYMYRCLILLPGA